MHQGSRGSMGWKEVGKEQGKSLDVVFGFPAIRTPTPLPLGLLKIYPATSIVLKTTSN